MKAKKDKEWNNTERIKFKDERWEGWMKAKKDEKKMNEVWIMN